MYNTAPAVVRMKSPHCGCEGVQMVAIGLMSGGCRCEDRKNTGSTVRLVLLIVNNRS